MRKILIVDDTTDSRVVLGRLLRLGGYQTCLADSGPSALSAIETIHPDLVVLDLMMPEMNGLEVLENLRKDPRFENLPVILYTALGQGELIDKAIDIGVQDVFIKGTSFGPSLLDRISEVLSHQHKSMGGHTSH
jgi:CheY-like chemotaxis protein